MPDDRSDIEYRIKTKADLSGVNELGDAVENKLAKKLDKVFGIGGAALALKGIVAGAVLRLLGKVIEEIKEIDALTKGLDGLGAAYRTVSEGIRSAIQVTDQFKTLQENLKIQSDYATESLRLQLSQLDAIAKRVTELTDAQHKLREARIGGEQDQGKAAQLRGAEGTKAIDAAYTNLFFSTKDKKDAIEASIANETARQKELVGEQPDEAALSKRVVELQRQEGKSAEAHNKFLEAQRDIGSLLSVQDSGGTPEDFQHALTLETGAGSLDKAIEAARGRRTSSMQERDAARGKERDILSTLPPGVTDQKSLYEYVSKTQGELNTQLNESAKKVMQWRQELQELDKALTTAKHKAEIEKRTIATQTANEVAKALDESQKKLGSDLKAATGQLHEALKAGNAGVVYAVNSLGETQVETVRDIAEHIQKIKKELEVVRKQLKIQQNQ